MTDFEQVNSGWALKACSKFRPPFSYESINPLTTNVPHHTETSQLIFSANQLTGFYMMGKTLVVNGLIRTLFPI